MPATFVYGRGSSKRTCFLGALLFNTYRWVDLIQNCYFVRSHLNVSYQIRLADHINNTCTKKGAPLSEQLLSHAAYCLVKVTRRFTYLFSYTGVNTDSNV